MARDRDLSCKSCRIFVKLRPSMWRDFLLGVLTTCAFFTLGLYLFVDQTTFTLKHGFAPLGQNECNAGSKSLEIGAKLDVEDLLILLWTPFKGSELAWQSHFGPAYGNFMHCGDPENPATMKAPKVTTNRTLIDQAHLVIFNLEDLDIGSADWKDTMLPPERTSALRPNQAWALFWRETPTKFENIARELSQLDGIFNWTISYRRDADIWYPNGFLTDITHKNSLIMPWRKIIKRKGMMSLMASKGCDSPSGAEAYARMLPQFDNKTFTTFNFGDCFGGNMPALDHGKNALDGLSKKIRFFLALEDEICDDYVTESFYRSLFYSYVPVVFGGPDIGYDEVALAGTYVNALEFDSERELVDYLKYLQGNPNEFAQYISWQNDFKVEPSLKWVCNLKKKMIKTFLGPEHRSYPPIGNFKEFWSKKKCYGHYKTAKFHSKW